MRVLCAIVSSLVVGAAPAFAAPDHRALPNFAVPTAAEASPSDVMGVRQFIDLEVAGRPKGPKLTAQDQVLYSVLSDQIREMRRKSALPAVMCLAEHNGDGTAETLSDDVMAQLVADNAEANDGLFTLKPATACVTSGSRIVDSETLGRALFVTAGPVDDEMKGLTSDCGDMVGGFVRADDDSDYDFYSVNGGDVARKLGCDLAQ